MWSTCRQRISPRPPRSAPGSGLRRPRPCVDPSGAAATCDPLLVSFEGEWVESSLSLCFFDCDPVSPAAPVARDAFVACAAGQTCELASVEHSACVGPAGTRTSGACESAGDCAPGHGCIDRQCRRFCWMHAPECGAGACVPVTGANGSRDAVLAGVARVGVCS